MISDPHTHASTVKSSSRSTLRWWLLFASIFLWLTPQGRTDPIKTVDLSGTWSFTPAGAAATTIQVPGGGWYKQGFTSISEADYATTITVPSVGQAQVTRLEFGAVNYQADVYLNNTLVGSSVQSFTPAAFDLTSYVVPGGSYSLRVHVKGRSAFLSGNRSLVPNAAGWSANTAQGIFRSARLLVYPQVYIADVFVRPSVKNVSLTYDVWLKNASSNAVSVILSGSLGSWNNDPWSYPAVPAQTISLPANTTTKVTVGPVNWNLGSGSYWWPNVPYQSGYTARLHLLNLSIVAASGGSALDQTSIRFGFRELLQASDGTNTCYFLNGIRVNFRGDNLQGADYDSIDSGGGRSDAYDTLPGFLPGATGWPRTVDNYQRLNYNFVRIHQEPAAPYMLDVCDEMGLMLMEETAIRGSANDQDFVNGHDNMVNHLKALFARDRNHPAIVRQSLSNEPNQSSTDSTAFETDLYNAAMSVDGTRPLSIDVGTPASTYESMAYANFSVYRHYGTGSQFNQYTDEVFARSDRPFGEGEFIWYADNTAQGFAWFATATQAMRAKGASDIRPYTLLSAWASFVPGVQTSQMQIEPAIGASSGGYPLYGENNLPDPWSNSQIQRVQAAFHPVLVADADYWSANKLSNSAGAWPVSVPFIRPGQTLTRNLTVYNDTFSGTAVDVTWELRQGSVAGAVAASGTISATVALGHTASQSITFTVPTAPDGTLFYLVLSTSKNGVALFREGSEQFVMLNQTPLTGTAFGATPAYSAGHEYDKASDGDTATYFDYSKASGGYTGIDLGANNARRISTIVYTPRTGFESRMVGGTFRGSNDGTNYTTLYTVASAPTGTTTVLVNTYTAYRYLEYVGPTNSYCDIAEMAFYTLNAQQLSGTAFGATPAYSTGREYDKASDVNTATFYDYAYPNGGYTGVDLGANNARTITSIVFTPRTGFESRMVGGTFCGSNDGVNYTTLCTITSTPSSATNNTIFVSPATAYRYLEYIGPSGSYCDIAEMAFQVSATVIAPPAAPAGLSVSAGDQQIAISWTPVSGANGYNVKRSQASGSNYITVATGVNGTSYTDIGLTDGATYYYVVASVNSGGEGANSAEASARPSAPISSQEAQTPPVFAITGSNGTLTIKSSMVGHTYQVQTTADLATQSWQNVGSTQAGTGNDLQIEIQVDAAASPRRFYRILIQR